MARGTSTGMEDGRGDGKRDDHKDDGRDGSLMLLVVVVVYVSVYASVAVAVARTIVVGVAVVVVVVLAVAVCVVVAASSAAATAATTASGWWVPARCAWAPAATRCVRAAGGRVIQAGCELRRRAGEQHAASRAAPCREGSRSGTRLAATSEQARDRCRSLPCKPRRHCLLPGTRCANRPRPPGTTAASARCHTRLLRTMGKDHRQGPTECVTSWRGKHVRTSSGECVVWHGAHRRRRPQEGAGACPHPTLRHHPTHNWAARREVCMYER